MPRRLFAGWRGSGSREHPFGNTGSSWQTCCQICQLDKFNVGLFYRFDQDQRGYIGKFHFGLICDPASEAVSAESLHGCIIERDDVDHVVMYDLLHFPDDVAAGIEIEGHLLLSI